MNKAWHGVFQVPVKNRSLKPRKTGLTMVIDKGLGLSHTEDLLQTAGEYIDIIKLTFGTSAFYDKEYLIRKARLITAARVDVMPGGTFFEVAVWQNRLEAYLDRAQELGFTAVEVSDGTIDMDLKTRKAAVKNALQHGLKVVTEVGKKDPKEALPIADVHKTIQEDIANGAFKVIIEAREAGKGVGIYDQEGQIKEDEVENILAGISNVDHLIWEAPIKTQQQSLILRWGPNVNLGNIPPDDILALEALRQGLRGDTLKRAYLGNKDWNTTERASKP